MGARASSTLRWASVWSIRSRNFPPSLRANSQLNRAVRTPPMCRYPVGLGAKRVRAMAPFRVEQQSLGLAGDVVAEAIAQLALDVFAVDRVETQPQPPQTPQGGRARQRQRPGVA